MGAPVGFTCPTIDSAISDADKALEAIDTAYDMIRGLTGRMGLLEELRDQNSKLRSWGEEMESERNEFEEERDFLQDEVDRLKSREVELEGEIEDLKRQLEVFWNEFIKEYDE